MSPIPAITRPGEQQLAVPPGLKSCHQHVNAGPFDCVLLKNLESGHRVIVVNCLVRKGCLQSVITDVRLQYIEYMRCSSAGTILSFLTGAPTLSDPQ